MKIEFEDVLKNVGDFGRYQLTLVLVYLIPALTVIPWFALNPIFQASTPDHWCFVPEVAASNLTLDQQQSLIRPKDNPSCAMHDVNYSLILSLGNWTSKDWPTKPCTNGWQYDKTHYDATSVSRWNMVCSDSHYASLVLSLIFVGDVIGTPLFGHICDRLGRRPTFFILAVITAVTEIGSVLIPNFTAFLVLRTINGSTCSTIYLVAYIILLEIVGTGTRARMNGISTTSWTFGLCLLPLVAWLTRSWIRLSIVTSSMGMALLLYWRILPESPRWLLSVERYEEAADIMAKISKANGKTLHESDQLRQQMQRLGEQMKKEKMGAESHSPLDFFRYPQLRKKFLLVTICWIANSMTYFGLQMNVKNLGGNEFVNFFLLSLVEFPSHLATWLFMERLGRRWCSVCAFCVSAIACLSPVFFSTELQLVGVVASLFGKVGSSSAFMTLYQQSPELYPTPLRGMGMGLSSTIATVTTLTVPYIVYLAVYNKLIPLLVFSAISVVGGACAAFLPETLNRKLPQTIADVELYGKNEKFFACTSKTKSFSQDSTCPPTITNTTELPTIPSSKLNGDVSLISAKIATEDQTSKDLCVACIETNNSQTPNGTLR